eukprot:724048-Alexandrium_andersonii.AAC.1
MRGGCSLSAAPAELRCPGLGVCKRVAASSSTTSQSSMSRRSRWMISPRLWIWTVSLWFAQSSRAPSTPRVGSASAWSAAQMASGLTSSTSRSSSSLSTAAS